jgi:hypothetical protein
VDELNRKRFFWGVLLAWGPWIPIMVGLGNALIGVSREKATGIGAVAGGLAEQFVMWGIVAVLISQITAIVMLYRAFSPGSWARSLFSMLSICLSGLMVLLVVFFLWFFWFQMPHAS